MTSDGNNFNDFPENQLAQVSTWRQERYDPAYICCHILIQFVHRQKTGHLASREGLGRDAGQWGQDTGRPRKYGTVGNPIQASRRLWVSAVLKMLIHAHFFGAQFRPVSRSDCRRVLAVRSEFISMSVDATLQVAVCSGYDLCHPG